MDKKQEIQHGYYLCGGCAENKYFKPQSTKKWSKKTAQHVYYVQYRCVDCRRESTRKWRENNPQKYKAHGAVFIALRNGFIKKEPCEICGNLIVEAHHVDYEKPLDVIWYCKEHHVIADRLVKLRGLL